MKKSLFLMLFLFAGMSMYAQGDLRLGVNAGLPVGDVDEISSFNLGVDAAYLFDAGEAFSVGPMIGFSHYFGKDFEGFEMEDVTFLPIAAAGRLGLGDSFFLGADLGYALGLKEGVDGGFYYRPKVGYNFGNMALNLSYSGVSVDGGSWSTLNVGLEFGL